MDAVSAVEPFLSGALAAGGKLVTSTCTGATADFPMSGYITTQTWAQKHPAAAKAFQQALEKGNAYANANPAVVRERAAHLHHHHRAGGGRLCRSARTRARSTTTPLQRIATLMKSGGLATPSDVSSLVFSS